MFFVETLKSIAARRKMNTLEHRAERSMKKRTIVSVVLELHEGAGGGRRNQ
jgi:hypothetical protein